MIEVKIIDLPFLIVLTVISFVKNVKREKKNQIVINSTHFLCVTERLSVVSFFPRFRPRSIESLQKTVNFPPLLFVYCLLKHFNQRPTFVFMKKRKFQEELDQDMDDQSWQMNLFAPGDDSSASQSLSSHWKTIPSTWCATPWKLHLDSGPISKDGNHDCRRRVDETDDCSRDFKRLKQATTTTTKHAITGESSLKLNLVYDQCPSIVNSFLNAKDRMAMCRVNRLAFQSIRKTMIGELVESKSLRIRPTDTDQLCLLRYVLYSSTHCFTRFSPLPMPLSSHSPGSEYDTSGEEDDDDDDQGQGKDDYNDGDDGQHTYPKTIESVVTLRIGDCQTVHDEFYQDWITLRHKMEYLALFPNVRRIEFRRMKVVPHDLTHLMETINVISNTTFNRIRDILMVVNHFDFMNWFAQRNLPVASEMVTSFVVVWKTLRSSIPDNHRVSWMNLCLVVARKLFPSLQRKWSLHWREKPPAYIIRFGGPVFVHAWNGYMTTNETTRLIDFRMLWPTDHHHQPQQHAQSLLHPSNCNGGLCSHRRAGSSGGAGMTSASSVVAAINKKTKNKKKNSKSHYV
jgi:hypothetical protein